MLDKLYDDILLIIINNLDYIDKCRLSHTNKYLLNIFDKYKNNIYSDNIICFKENKHYHCNTIDELKDYKINYNNLLIKAINKFPNIKIRKDNQFRFSKECNNNIYDYYFSNEMRLLNDEEPHEINLINIINSCNNIKIMSLISSNIKDISLLKNLYKIHLWCCPGITDISMLNNIYDISIYECNNINIMPNIFNSSILSFNCCKFITNDTLKTFNNVNKLKIKNCINITKINNLLYIPVKKLTIINDYEIIIDFPILNNLDKLTISEKFDNLNNLGDNINRLTLLSCYKLKTIPKITNLKSLVIINNNFDIPCMLNYKLNYLINLEELTIEDWLCFNLNCLSSLTKLKFLYLDSCKLHSLPNLLYLNKLKIINCLNITSLPKIKNVIELYLKFCDNLSNINSLINIKHMNKLYLNCKKIKTIKPLENIISIDDLDLNMNNNIINLSYLNNIKINNLTLSNCYVSINDLNNLKNLNSLTIYNNKINISDDILNELSIKNNIKTIIYKIKYYLS
jgi:hypothetical protein